MKHTLMDILRADHERIRAMFLGLQREADKIPPNEEVCFRHFRALKNFLAAHTKSKEFHLYAYFEESVLKRFCFEGYEEHDLVDFVMKEMGMEEEVSAQWRARLTVAFELLQHHLEKEEREFFPKVKELFTEEELEQKGDEYLKERDEIFARRNKPAKLVYVGGADASFV